MAELTDAEREALFQRDVDIINKLADEKIGRIREQFKAIESKHVADVEKRRMKIQASTDKFKASLQKSWDKEKETAARRWPERLPIIDKKYSDRLEVIELSSDQKINGIIESDNDVVEMIKDKFEEKIQKVDLWRESEQRAELKQLQTHTQRARK